MFMYLLPYWRLNESSHEMEYWIPSSQHSGEHACGFISVSAAGQSGDGVPAGYMADVLESRGAAESVSRLFNTFDGAKSFVEKECKTK
jgi:hypothetical protein